MEYTSASGFRVVFDKALVTVLYHDLCEQLTQTDFEQRFYFVHAQKLLQLHQAMKEQIVSKRLFNFAAIDKLIITEIVETLFYYAAKMYQTFPMEEYKNKELYKELEEFEEQIARFELFGSKVEAKDSFSEGFVKEAIKQLINELYIDLFWCKCKKITHTLDQMELKDRYQLFYYEQIRNWVLFHHKGIPVNFDEEGLKSHLEQQLNHDADLFHPENSKTIVENVNKLMQHDYLSGREEMTTFLSGYFSKEIVVDLYLHLSGNRAGLNVSEELQEYMASAHCNLNAIFTKFLLHFTKKSYRIEWFVPCFPGYYAVEEWPSFFDLELMVRENVVESFAEVELLATKIKENQNQIWVKFCTDNTYRDIEFTFYQLQQRWNDYVNVLHFADPYKVPITFKEFEGVYKVTDTSTDTINYGQNGFEAAFQPPLTERAIKIKKDNYKELVNDLIAIPDEHNLKKRLLLSLRYYRDHLQATSYGDKLLKLWHCLEVLSQQDNVDKIEEMLAIFPAIRPSRIYPNDRLQKLTAEERPVFFRNQKQYFADVIKNFGIIRNEYVAHVNRGAFIQEWRYKRHVNQLRIIVVGIQQIIVAFLKHDPSVDKVRKIQKKLEKDYL